MTALIDRIQIHGHWFEPSRPWQDSWLAPHLARPGVGVIIELRPGEPSPVLGVAEGPALGQAIKAAAAGLQIHDRTYVLTHEEANAAKRAAVATHMRATPTILVD